MITETREPSFVAETLAWCNEKRKERNMELLSVLPKGKVGDPNSCPCGKATGLSVGTCTWEDRLMDYSGKLPQSVMDFVCEFDGHRLPQYIEEPEQSPQV